MFCQLWVSEVEKMGNQVIQIWSAMNFGSIFSNGSAHPFINRPQTYSPSSTHHLFSLLQLQILVWSFFFASSEFWNHHEKLQSFSSTSSFHDHLGCLPSLYLQAYQLSRIRSKNSASLCYSLLFAIQIWHVQHSIWCIT